MPLMRRVSRQLKPTGTSMGSLKRTMSSGAFLPAFVPPRGQGYLSAQNILNKQELKFFDTAISTAIDTTTEVITQCNLVDQGDTASTRDGNIIEVKSLEIQGRFAQVPGAAANSAPIVYLWVVLDRQPNGAALTPVGAVGTTAYLVDPSGNGLNQALLPLPANQYRFKTLARIQVELTSPAGVTTAYNNVSKNFSWYKKFKKPIQIRFNSPGSGIVSVSTNNLSIVAGCTDADDTVSFIGTARIRFTG